MEGEFLLMVVVIMGVGEKDMDNNVEVGAGLSDGEVGL